MANSLSGEDAFERKKAARSARKLVWPLLGAVMVILSMREFLTSDLPNWDEHGEPKLLAKLDAVNFQLERISTTSDSQQTTPESESQRQILEELRKNVHAISRLVASDASTSEAGADLVGVDNDADIEKGPTKPKFPYHVLFCISGDKEGFLSEFEVSLKSVILNAPLEAPLDVHVMADAIGFQALDDKVWNQTGVEKFTTRHPIQIHVYNVQPLMPQFEAMIVQLYKKAYKSDYNIGESTNVHTIGAMFRLLAHLVVPKHVQKILYLDPDAVLMANLQELWRNLEVDPVFHWGGKMCSGFVVLDVQQLPEVWRLAGESPMMKISKKLRQGPNDQLVFKSVNITFPERVGILPDAWDNSAAEMRFLKTKLLDLRPELGMLHFNGGGGSTKSAYLTHGFIHGDLEKFPEMKHTWGLVHYYARIPWEWARFWASSMVDDEGTKTDESDASARATNSTKEGRRPGHPLTIIRHNDLDKNMTPAESITPTGSS